LFIMPIWLQKLISNKIFRKKNDVEVNKWNMKEKKY
jgi:hypothetical protein